jgi:hypothetical protein
MNDNSSFFLIKRRIYAYIYPDLIAMEHLPLKFIKQVGDDYFQK